MKTLKEKDILKYLEGSSNGIKKKEVKAWAKSNPENGKELALYKRIIKESTNLESFNLVDEVQEWKSFQKRTSPLITDIDILNHMDGFSNFSQKKNIEAWAANSDSNKKDMEVFDLLYKEVPMLKEYTNSNADLEWSKFQSSLQEVKVEKVEIPVSRKLNLVPMWQRYAAAAAIALLLTVTIWQFVPKDPYAEFATTDQVGFLQLEDGSEVELAPHSSLRYPKSMANHDERRLYLKGAGKFDVVRNPDKPFFLEVDEGDIQNSIGVEVLGTIFSILDDDNFVKVVENIEGSVKIYKLNNRNVSANLDAGDKYGFNGSDFVDMKPVLEVVDDSKEYDILYVVDYLMEVSDWRVITSPYSEFEEEGKVKIDIEKPYEAILEDLSERANFEYSELSCDGCYIIRKFTSLKDL